MTPTKLMLRPEEVTALLWQDIGRAYLERAEQLLRVTATPETHADTADRWLTAQEVAKALGMTAGYVYLHANDFGFTRRVGRRVRFSAQGLRQYLLERTPSDGRPRRDA